MLKNRSFKKCRIFLDLAEFFLKTGRQIFKGPGNSAQDPKGAANKTEGPEKLVAEFLPDLQKRAKSGRTFSNSCLRDT
jgi:hypothetical protein